VVRDAWYARGNYTMIYEQAAEGSGEAHTLFELSINRRSFV